MRRYFRCDSGSRLREEKGLKVSVRGGGHSVSGSCVVDDGMVVDLGLMRGVWVDPRTQTARVQGGATWGEFDREAQLFGLATPGGRISTTGWIHTWGRHWLAE
ncbi:hypothetical protein B9Q12_01010 [Candidatus Marsarchaeota G2 archaeon ECH_B_SAG-G06]|uniref:FAD-binding PCMH-type domain-containing protein n=2 Tax=Candidatus Marsarchaeota TaxID=1978152 RepID=A0A2R6C2R3_9ARCH|nr:MAG: hypothetical protein B9Q12_01010 [Candidatus Marsarchaeota G2 archaeon ECH_B_SAG-G06]